MLNVVIDTNVLISALLYGGNSKIIIEQLNKKTFEAVTSHELISELLKKLSIKFNFSKSKLLHLEAQILSSFIVVYPTIEVLEVRDKEDNIVLEAAIEGNCEYIVTGDKDLLELKKYKNIRIVNPKDFLDIINQRK